MPHKIDGGTRGKKYSVTQRTEDGLAAIARDMGAGTYVSEALRVAVAGEVERRKLALPGTPPDPRQTSWVKEVPDTLIDHDVGVRPEDAGLPRCPTCDVRHPADHCCPRAYFWKQGDPHRCERCKRKAAGPTLGERLRIKREVDGLTPGELAAKLGLRLSVIEGMEDGIFPLTPAATAWLGPVRELKPGESLWPEDIGAPLTPGERLKAARLAAGFARPVDLGRHLEISRSTVERAEKGQQVPLGDALSAWLERHEAAAK